MQVLSLGTKTGSLLIPLPMVAQIVSRSIHTPYDHNCPFVRESIIWREMSLPLVYCSEMLGEESGADENYIQSVVIWPMKGTEATDLISLTSLVAPHVLNINEDISFIENQPESDDADNADDKDSKYQFRLGMIQLENQLGIIPDLKLLSDNIFST